MPEPALLSVEQVSVRFGGVKVLDGVDLELRPGQILGLIGPNGAGKTTLFDVVTGVTAPAAGRVRLAGVDVTRWPAHRRGRAGMARTFQRPQLFGGLSVYDNLLGAWEASRRAGRTFRARHEGHRCVADAIEQFDLGHLAAVPARRLTTDQSRLVELARALCVEPRVLLLDEPSSGLDPAETATFRDVLIDAVRGRRSDLGVLFIEHDTHLVMDVCDTIAVLDLGRRVACGVPAEVRSDPAVIAAYLGGMAGEAA